MNGPYATNKLAYHLPVLEQMRRGEQPAPIAVTLVLSDLCNQDCGFCMYRLSGHPSNQLFNIIDASGRDNHNPNRMIPTAKAIEVLDDLAAMGTKAVIFSGGGEPTIHPKCATVMEACLGRGMEAALISNAVKWSDSLTSLLPRCSWVRVSFDAGTPETYARIRRGSVDQYRRAWANVQRLTTLRNELGSKLVVGAGFVVCRENWSEVVAFTNHAKAAGVDNVRISAAYQPGGVDYFGGWGGQAAELCRDAEGLACAGFEVFNMFAERATDAGRPDYSFCGYQQVQCFIGGDQNVYRCCVLSYNERGLLGSVKGRRFRDVWESQAKRDDYSSFDARGCSMCQFNAKNREIAAMVKLAPECENFV